MSSCGAATTEPPGAPRPFDNETIATSNGAASSATEHPETIAAFQRRAPSRYVEIPRGAAGGATAVASAGGTTTPPARLWVFSTSTSVVGGYIGCAFGLTAASNSAGGNDPPLPISVSWTPAVAALPPASCQTA